MDDVGASGQNMDTEGATTGDGADLVVVEKMDIGPDAEAPEADVEAGAEVAEETVGFAAGMVETMDVGATLVEETDAAGATTGEGGER